MKKWEYKIEGLRRGLLDESFLNKLGDDSWELTAFENGLAYFKRPKVDEDAGWVPIESPLLRILREREREQREALEHQTQALCRDSQGPYIETRGMPR